MAKKSIPERVPRQQSASNLAWRELEMTGLNPQEDVMLRAALIITDVQLNVSGGLIEGEVAQVFTNNTNTALEAAAMRMKWNFPVRTFAAHALRRRSGLLCPSDELPPA